MLIFSRNSFPVLLRHSGAHPEVGCKPQLCEQQKQGALHSRRAVWTDRGATISDQRGEVTVLYL